MKLLLSDTLLLDPGTDRADRWFDDAAGFRGWDILDVGDDAEDGTYQLVSGPRSLFRLCLVMLRRLVAATS